MLVKKTKLRVLFLISIFTVIPLTVFLLLKYMEREVVYFLSPTEIKNLKEIKLEKIRIGDKSIIIDTNKINFVITDFKNEIIVSYSGSIPNLFAENKGVVAEGYLRDKNFLNAKRILAKHDENYMPPEVKKALEYN